MRAAKWIIFPDFGTDPLELPEFQRLWIINTPNGGSFDLLGTIDEFGNVTSSMPLFDVFVVDRTNPFEVRVSTSFPDVYNQYDSIVEFSLDCGSNRIDVTAEIVQDPILIGRGFATYSFDLAEDCTVSEENPFF